MKIGHYKLARAAGGICHFALVTLRLAVASKPTAHGRELMGSSDGEILDEWLQSALAGARAAIEFGCPGSGLDVVEFTEFRGCLADTSNSAAWCAAAMAALCALDLPNAKPVYDIDKGRWAVELPSGEMLEMR